MSLMHDNQLIECNGRFSNYELVHFVNYVMNSFMQHEMALEAYNLQHNPIVHYSYQFALLIYQQMFQSFHFI